LIADDYGSAAIHPLVNASFVAALARAGGRSGWAHRTETMRILFGDLLPAELIERKDKGEFTRAIWKERAQTFAANWDGSGVDADLVDVEALRTIWRAERPFFHTMTLLHSAWLAGRSDSRR
jgi:asparagine synthase (glutamine-hydrolysing)